MDLLPLGVFPALSQSGRRVLESSVINLTWQKRICFLRNMFLSFLFIFFSVLTDCHSPSVVFLFFISFWWCFMSVTFERVRDNPHVQEFTSHKASPSSASVLYPSISITSVTGLLIYSWSDDFISCHICFERVLCTIYGRYTSQLNSFFPFYITYSSTNINTHLYNSLGPAPFTLGGQVPFMVRRLPMTHIMNI